MEMRWILLGKKHVGQSFKGFLVGFWDGAHQIEGFFRLGELMIADPKADSKEDQEQELLAFPIADYESRTVKIPSATPAEAIRFRMEHCKIARPRHLALRFRQR